jgi:hypothetical protein
MVRIGKSTVFASIATPSSTIDQCSSTPVLAASWKWLSKHHWKRRSPSYDLAMLNAAKIKHPLLVIRSGNRCDIRGLDQIQTRCTAFFGSARDRHIVSVRQIYHGRFLFGTSELSVPAFGPRGIPVSGSCAAGRRFKTKRLFDLVAEVCTTGPIAIICVR